MSSYLENTPPSFYDLDGFWCCTIGKYEHEKAAWHITKFCQENGDRWQPVLVVEWFPDEPMEMPEHWLCALQSVRVRLEGPPELIRNDRARGGLQLRYPHGDIRAASFDYSDKELADFRRLTLRRA